MENTDCSEKEYDKKLSKWTTLFKYVGIPILMLLLSIGGSLATYSFKAGEEAEKISMLETSVSRLDQTDKNNQERSNIDHDRLIRVEEKVNNIEKSINEIKEDLKFKTKGIGKNENLDTLSHSIYSGGNNNHFSSAYQLQP